METISRALAMFLERVEKGGAGNSSFCLVKRSEHERLAIDPRSDAGHVDVHIWSGRLGVMTLWQTHTTGGVPIYS